MNNFERPFTFDRVVRIVITTAILVGLYFFINAISGALLPFLVAWLIAYLINPLVEFYQHRLRMRGRILSITAALVSITIVFMGLLRAVVPSIRAEVVKFADMVGSFNASANDIPFVPQSWLDFIGRNIDFSRILQELSHEDLVRVIETLVPQMQRVFSGSVTVIIGIMGLFVVVLYVIFILLDYDRIPSTFIDLIPPKFREGVRGIMTDVKDSMNRYFRGQALVAFCVGILCATGFRLIGLPLAILLGLFIGLLNLVPYLQVVGFIPTFLLCLLKSAQTGQNFWVIAALAALVFVVVQIIQDGFLVPRIMGRITGLKPAIILLSLSIWGSLMGVVGMIIALPMTTLMLSYYQRFVIDNEKLYVDDTGE